VNGKPVTLHENIYHYKYYLEKLLDYGSDANSTHLITSFWYPDTATDDGLLKADAGNSGYVRRLGHLFDSKTVEVIGRLHGDLFNSNSMLINGVDMNIKLTRAPSSFYLLRPADDSKMKIKIMEAIYVSVRPN
jgi:hypothetical protein